MGKTSRSHEADLPKVRRALWAIAVVILLAVNVALLILYLLSPTVFVLPPLPEDLRTLIAPLYLPVVSTVLPLLLSILLLFSWWRLRLEQLCWKAGPIEVSTFTDTAAAPATATEGPDVTSSAKTSNRAVECTALFQSHLATSRLYSTTAVPGAVAASEFLRAVESAGEAAKGLWHAATRFACLISPRVAYRVTASMVDGGPGRPCVLVVELTRMPARSATPLIVRDSTWAGAVEHAAQAVIALVLPRTRQCKRPPWNDWRGLRLPTSLFSLYLKAQQLQAGRRYDEALLALYDAVKEDPANLYLRLDVAQMQERLDMYMDALLTYDDIISVASASDRRLRGWWSRSNGAQSGDVQSEDAQPGGMQPRGRRRARLEPVLLVARYRHALLLGLSEQLASQWWHREEKCTNMAHWSERELRRAQLRCTIRSRMNRYIDYLGDSICTNSRKWYIKDFLETQSNVMTKVDRAERSRIARIFFAKASQYEIERLVEDYRWRIRWVLRGRHDLNRILPQRSLRVCLAWAPLRQSMALHATGESANRSAVSVYRPDESVRLDGLTAVFTDAGWPPCVKELKKVVSGVLGRRGKLRSWHDHYNAACVFALALLPVEVLLKDQEGQWYPADEPAASLAVNELRNAVACSDSGYLARQREWIVAEDPDLSVLRATRVFREFEEGVFGSFRLSPHRGTMVHVWEQVAYMATIVHKAALRIEELWHARADGASAENVHLLQQWLKEDADAWRWAERVANNYRDWSTRARLLARLGGWPDVQGESAMDVCYPVYSDSNLKRQVEALTGTSVTLIDGADHNLRNEVKVIEKNMNLAITLSNRRMEELAWIVRYGDDKVPVNASYCFVSIVRHFALDAEHRAWLDAFDEVDFGKRDLPSNVSELCSVYTERWKRLAAWFDDSGRLGYSAAERRSSFVSAMQPVLPAGA